MRKFLFAVLVAVVLACSGLSLYLVVSMQSISPEEYMVTETEETVAEGLTETVTEELTEQLTEALAEELAEQLTEAE